MTANEPMSDERLANQFATPFEAAERILARCRKYRRADVADIEALAGLVSDLVLSEAADTREIELLDATTRAETAERTLATQRKANHDVAKQCLRAMERATNAERELAESLDALTAAAELIDRLTDDSTCDYDHHDNCRTHSLHKRPCPHPLGRQFVEAWRAVEAEQQKAADDDH